MLLRSITWRSTAGVEKTFFDYAWLMFLGYMCGVLTIALAEFPGGWGSGLTQFQNNHWEWCNGECSGITLTPSKVSCTIIIYDSNRHVKGKYGVYTKWQNTFKDSLAVYYETKWLNYQKCYLDSKWFSSKFQWCFPQK